jgi:hypothetical protein
VSMFLMLDLMLDFMLHRLHAMTHVALRASSDDDVSNQGAPWLIGRHTFFCFVRPILSRFNDSDDVRSPNFGPVANN